MPATTNTKRMPATWANVSPGQTVYIDNYEGGRFPQADPRTSGPYVVASSTRRLLRHASPSKHQAPFMHYPDNLLARPQLTRASTHPRLTAVAQCALCRHQKGDAGPRSAAHTSFLAG